MLLALALLPLAAQAALKPGAPTVLITGANRGIGLELARQYAAEDWNVIATTRRPLDDAGTADLKAIAAKHPQLAIERIDVTDTAMIRSVAQKYKDQPIDVLVNNAAAVEATFQADLEKVNIPYDKIDFDAARTDFDVNTLGPMRMIQAFMPNVEKSKQKKMVNVTSFIGSFGRGGTGHGHELRREQGRRSTCTVKLAFAHEAEGRDRGAGGADSRGEQAGRGVEPDVEARRCGSGEAREGDRRLTMERAGKITNFSTGEIDPY